MRVWQSVLDAQTCEWCRSRHGKAAKPPSPRIHCSHPDGCRCLDAEEPQPTVPQQVLAVQSAGVSVVYHAQWTDGTRAFLHLLLAAAPYAGASVECPGTDYLLRVNEVIFRREAVVLRCLVGEPFHEPDRETMRAAGWGFA